MVLEMEVTVDPTPPHPNPLPEGEGTGRRALSVGAWLIVFVIALALDSGVAMFMRDRGVDDFIHAHNHLQSALKLPGEYRFTFLVTVLAAILHPRHLRAGVF